MVEITRSERMATSIYWGDDTSDTHPARSLATRLEVRRGGLSYHELRARRRANLGRDGRDLVEHGGLVEGQDPAVAERPSPVDHDGGHRGGAGVLDQMRHRHGRAGQCGAPRIEQHEVGSLPWFDAAELSGVTDGARAPGRGHFQ